MKRRRCLKKGHKYKEHIMWSGSPLPYLFCRRWGCNASTVSSLIQGPLRQSLLEGIPKDQRA